MSTTPSLLLRPKLLLLVLSLAACGTASSSPFPPEVRLEGGSPCLTYVEGYSKGIVARTLKFTPGPGQEESGSSLFTVSSSSPTLLVAGTGGGTPDESNPVLVQPGETGCVELLWADTAEAGVPDHIDVSISHLGNVISTVRLDTRWRPRSVMRPIEDRWADLLLVDPVQAFRAHELEKARYESSHKQPPKTPNGHTETVGQTTERFAVDAQWLANFNTLFPEGTNGRGQLTLAPRVPPSPPKPGAAVTELVEGDHLIVGLVFDGPIPLSSPDKEYQYVVAGFQDDDPSNDFVPLPAFPGDTLRGTDKWYVVTYNPIDGWQLEAIDARNNANQVVASTARLILSDNALVLVVPTSEIDPEQPLHFSAMEHDGSFGQQPPFEWSIDYHPIQDDEPTEPIGSGPPPPTPAPPPGPGSPEAQAFNGSWRLDGDTDHCIQIVDGSIVSWDEGCDGSPLTITQNTPGRTNGPFVIWELTVSDGRRFVLNQHTDTSVNLGTALDVFVPPDTLGIRTFPDLVAVP